MRKSNKAISLILILVLVALVAMGCNSNNDEKETQGGDSTGVVENNSDKDNEDSSDDDASKEPVVTAAPSILDKETLDNPNVIIDAYWEITDQAILSAISEFEAKYGGTVTVNVIGWNQGAKVMTANMAAGTVSDLIFTEGNMCFPSYVVDGYFQPIDQYIDESSPYMDQASLDNFLYKGEHYVFTNYAITSPYLVIYNKTMFDEEGLETPVELFDKGQWTYDKFLEYLDYFTRDLDGDGEIDQWGLGPRYKRQNFQFANGAFTVYENTDGTLGVGIDSEKNVQYLDFLNDFGQIQKSNAPGDSGWLENRVSAMFSEAGPSAGISADYAGNDEFDFVPLPTADGSLATTPVWDNGYALCNGAPNPEGAGILGTMIAKAKMESYDAQLAEKYSVEQVERYKTIMASTVPQRREYPEVSNNVGEGDALEGMPAQTIIETYKSQLDGEVEAYNNALNK